MFRVLKHVERRDSIPTEKKVLSEIKQSNGSEFPVQINEIVWPGTHDSATKNSGGTTDCSAYLLRLEQEPSADTLSVQNLFFRTFSSCLNINENKPVKE